MITEHKTGIGRVETLECQAASGIARMSNLATWAQHGHIQCAHNTHLLGELRHTPAITIFTL